MRRRALAAALAAPLLAQAPRPVRILVGFPPGAVPDATARLLAPGLAARLGQPVVVENRPGAASGIAAEAVLRAPADGHTLLLMPFPLLGLKLLVKGLGFDPAEFVPLAGALSASMVLVATPGLGVADFAGFLARARADGDALAFGTTGAASAQALAMGLLAEAAGLANTRLTFRGEVEITTALLGGALQAAFLFPGAAAALVQEGRLRGLAVSAPERMPQLPALPTLAEAGFPAASFSTWWGVAVAPGTPPALQATLAEALAAARDEPAVVARIEGLGGRPLRLEGAAMQAFAAREGEALRALLGRLGVQPE